MTPQPQSSGTCPDADGAKEADPFSAQRTPVGALSFVIAERVELLGLILP
jgi:hypothetical protein